MKTVVSYNARKGFSRAFDLNVSQRSWPNIANPDIKDYEAIRRDWKAIGDDIRRAERNFKATNGN